MPLKLEPVSDPHVTFPVWKKEYAARGTLSLCKDAATDQPVLKFQPAYNVGDRAPEPQFYRINF